MKIFCIFYFQNPLFSEEKNYVFLQESDKSLSIPMLAIPEHESGEGIKNYIFDILFKEKFFSGQIFSSTSMELLPLSKDGYFYFCYKLRESSFSEATFSLPESHVSSMFSELSSTEQESLGLVIKN